TSKRERVATDDSQQIEALEREWRDALCRKDMEKLGSLVHPDFVLIGTRSTGPFMMARDEWLDAIQRREVESIEVEVRDATVLAQVEVGTVPGGWGVKYLGRIIEGCLLLAGGRVVDGGRWEAIRPHSAAGAGDGDSKA